MSIEIVNLRDWGGEGAHAAYARGEFVYIGRRNVRYGMLASKWANPFAIGPDGTREEVIAKYRFWLLEDSAGLVADLSELKDKRLACWCAPLPCHGQVIRELVEGRCYYCGHPIWEHDYVFGQWQAGEDWSEHVFELKGTA